MILHRLKNTELQSHSIWQLILKSVNNTEYLNYSQKTYQQRISLHVKTDKDLTSKEIYIVYIHDKSYVTCIKTHIVFNIQYLRKVPVKA